MHRSWPKFALLSLLCGLAPQACTSEPSTGGPMVPGVPDVAPNPAVPAPGNGNQPVAGGNTPTPATNPNGAGNTNVAVPVPRGPATRIVGRADTVTDSNGPMIAWPGTQVVIGFVGTQLTVNLVEVDTTRYDGQSQNNFFDVSVDGVAGTRIKLTQAASSYQVARGLPNAQHTVVLTKRTEGQVGRVLFRGATTDGKLTDTPGAQERRIEFVGDSGTAGYGADGNAPCDFTAATENANVAYPMVVGSMLNADVHSISYSGKGIVQNRDMVNDNYKVLPVLWSWTLPVDRDQTDWKPATWVPQAVVMTIGGNDFFTQILPEATFNAALVKFIKQVQAAYPGVHVFVGVSPMLRDDNFTGDPAEPGTWTLAGDRRRTAGVKYAKDAVASLADARVHYLDLPYDDGSRRFGCDMHMSPATHKFMATPIVAALKAALAW
jgi:lysophospholipase L1-like esterase